VLVRSLSEKDEAAEHFGSLSVGKKLQINGNTLWESAAM
jgi:hypothetical protein